MDEVQAVVFVNRGWYVAQCPYPYCDHAEYFGVATNGAGVGGLTPEYMMCGNCGRGSRAVWPDYDMRQGIEQLLALRPDPKTRNWLPTETLHDLLEENTAHGVLPDRERMTILDGTITEGRDALPRRHERLMLPGIR